MGHTLFTDLKWNILDFSLCSSTHLNTCPMCYCEWHSKLLFCNVYIQYFVSACMHGISKPWLCSNFWLSNYFMQHRPGRSAYYYFIWILQNLREWNNRKEQNRQFCKFNHLMLSACTSKLPVIPMLDYIFLQASTLHWVCLKKLPEIYNKPIWADMKVVIDIIMEGVKVQCLHISSSCFIHGFF